VPPIRVKQDELSWRPAAAFALDAKTAANIASKYEPHGGVRVGEAFMHNVVISQASNSVVHSGKLSSNAHFTIAPVTHFGIATARAVKIDVAPPLPSSAFAVFHTPHTDGFHHPKCKARDAGKDRAIALHNALKLYSPMLCCWNLFPKNVFDTPRPVPTKIPGVFLKANSNAGVPARLREFFDYAGVAASVPIVTDDSDQKVCLAVGSEVSDAELAKMTHVQAAMRDGWAYVVRSSRPALVTTEQQQQQQRMVAWMRLEPVDVHGVAGAEGKEQKD
jgi:hypothetical protein